MKKLYLLSFFLLTMVVFSRAQFTINTQFINPCGGDEHNEFVVAKTGTNSVNIANLAFGSYNPSSNSNGTGGTAIKDYNYWWAGTNVPNSPYPTFSNFSGESCGAGVNCYGFRYPSIPADNTDINTLIDELNGIAGCSVFLPVPATNIIPANSNVIVFLGAGYKGTSGLCGFNSANTNLNFSNHCSAGTPITTYYAVFGTGDGAGTNCSNVSGGYFSNSSRRISALHVFNGGSNTNINNYSTSLQDYTPGTTPASGNAGVITPGGSATTWIDDQGCIPLPSVIVPIKLEYFTGELRDSKGLLQWKNAFEQDIRMFVVEKSLNGTDFYPLKNVDPKNISGSVYTVVDESLSSGANFYRLKVLNINGKIDHSTIVKINFANGIKSHWFVYPSPAVSNASLIYQSTAAKLITLKIVDVVGRLISKTTVKILSGNNEIDLKAEKLSSGMYFIKISDGANISSVPFLKK